MIISSLVEGNSIRATCRMIGVAKGTVLKLLEDIGTACAAYQNKVLRNLPCKTIQCDEVWSFCYAKQKNVPEEFKGQLGFGDVWTWTAICSDTKLAVSWHVGKRDGEAATGFIKDVSERVANRIQLTTDGNHLYVEAVEKSFGGDIDYAMLIKLYDAPPDQEVRYSPSQCRGTIKTIITGNPKQSKVSTSFVERQNLTMRMGMRRFTRLTNAFSKKIQNLEHAVSLHFMYYNVLQLRPCPSNPSCHTSDGSESD